MPLLLLCPASQGSIEKWKLYLVRFSFPCCPKICWCQDSCCGLKRTVECCKALSGGNKQQTSFLPLGTQSLVLPALVGGRASVAPPHAYLSVLCVRTHPSPASSLGRAPEENLVFLGIQVRTLWVSTFVPSEHGRGVRPRAVLLAERGLARGELQPMGSSRANGSWVKPQHFAAAKSSLTSVLELHREQQRFLVFVAPTSSRTVTCL